jgi:pimeloyl-ACP methyl ester carboxylesterase
MQVIQAFRRRSFLAIIGIAVVAVIGVVLYFGPDQPQPGFQPERCWFSEDAYWLDTERGGPDVACGRMYVSEDRDLPSANLISFPVAIFKGDDRSGSKGSPVMIAGGGGPGGPIGLDDDEMVHWLWETFHYVSRGKGRDLILIDNRGVGLSEPHLNCPEVDALGEGLDEIIALEVRVEAVRENYRACRERLEELGVAVGEYNSLSAAQDIEDLRLALGIEQWNLIGISYGTRIVLTVMREFPTSVRAALLDSIVPLEIAELEESPRDHEASFERIIRACESDAGCRALVPSFGAELARLLDELRTEPLIIDVNAFENAETDVIVDDEVLAYVLFNTVYSELAIGIVPLVIRRVLDGDYRALAPLIDALLEDIDALDDGAYVSYSCYDEIPFNSIDRALQEANKYPLQRPMSVPRVKLEVAACEGWDIAPGADIEALPVISDIPTLIYAGEYDPVTPPRWAEHAKNNLSNAHLKVWPAIGHAVTAGSSCAVRVAGQFFDEPERSPFDLYCMVNADKRRIEFRTR